MEKNTSRNLQAVLCAGLVGAALWQPVQANEQPSPTAGSGLSLARADMASSTQALNQSRIELAAMESESAFINDWTQRDEWDVSVGLSAVNHARYLGSREKSTYFRPFFSVSKNWGPYYLDSSRGLGVAFKTDSGLKLGAALAYDPGRGEEKSNTRPGSARLQGMGKVKGAPVAMLHLGHELTPMLSVDTEFGLRLLNRKESGNFYSLGLNATVYEEENDSMRLHSKVHWGSKRFNQANFGVTDAQARTSNFNRFDARSGFYAYSLGADWTHRFNRHWSMTGGVEMMLYRGSVSNSPIIEKKHSFSTGAAVVYTF